MLQKPNRKHINSFYFVGVQVAEIWHSYGRLVLTGNSKIKTTITVIYSFLFSIALENFVLNSKTDGLFRLPREKKTVKFYKHLCSFKVTYVFGVKFLRLPISEPWPCISRVRLSCCVYIIESVEKLN